MPEIIIAGTGVVIVLADLVMPRRQIVTGLAFIGILAAAVAAMITGYTHTGQVFGGMLVIDGWSQFMRIVLLLASGSLVLVSTAYYEKLHNLWAEYHALVLFALTGMMLMSSTGNLISAFISIEITAVSFFILTGMLKDGRSSEGSLKMMLIGGIAAAVMLYGMAFIFGFTGNTQLSDIAMAISGQTTVPAGLMLGVLLLAAGLLFETAAVPFHMWAPDTYEGAPTPVTLYLSAASKVAGMAVIARVFTTAFTQPATLSTDWGLVVAGISAATMTLGNLMALSQTNIKRLLAYSGIAHTGYMLIGVSVLGLSQGLSGQPLLLFYLLAFVLAEIAVFTAVIVITRQLKTDETGDFAGLSRRSPFLTVVLSLGLISLAGLPPTAGFMAKLFIFTGAVDAGLLWLVIIAVLNTVISAFYYFKVIKLMWVHGPETNGKISTPPVPGLVAAVTGGLLLLLGIAPYLLLRLAENSAMLLP